MTKVLLATSSDFEAMRTILEAYKKVNHPGLGLTIRPKPQTTLTSRYKKLVEELGIKATVDNTTPLKKQFQEHNIVLGTCSTVLIEAIIFGKIVGACSYLEYDKDLFFEQFEKLPFFLIDSEEKLKQRFKEWGNAPYDERD